MGNILMTVYDVNGEHAAKQVLDLSWTSWATTSSLRAAKSP